MKIVYMGTPEFACKPLLALHESRHEIAIVVTGLDKRRGRRGEPRATDVHCVAGELGLPVLTPKSLRSEQLYQELRACRPDLIAVVAFRILPERLFSLPEFGAVNIHASLLPKYRGAAPINWALINGERETGLTSFFLNAKIDTGNIILQERTAIGEDENCDSLRARLSEMSGPFLLRTIDLIEQEGFTPTLQDESRATPAPKIGPLDALIDFGLPAARVRDFVRGLSTRPGAYTWFRGKKVKILVCRKAETSVAAAGRPGSVIPAGGQLVIRCADSAVEVQSLIPEGKKAMDGRSFVNGFRPQAAELFGEPVQGIKE